MASNSKISWTDATWNPVSGCTKVSDGCVHCFAERYAIRFHRKQPRLKGTIKTHCNRVKGWSGVVRCHEDQLEVPLHWRKPRKIFVCSMSDLFHPDVPFGFVHQVLAVTQLCPQHQFQILTKRPERMADCLNMCGVGFDISQAIKRLHLPVCYGALARDQTGGPLGVGGSKGWPLLNLWLGTSIETQDQMWRAAELLRCPATVRFLSLEPLLSYIQLPVKRYRTPGACPHGSDNCSGCWSYELPGIHWVIVGGESGRGARPMKLEWVQSIIAQCRAANVPVFVKQLCKNGRPIPIALWPPDVQIQEWPKGVAA